MNARWSEGLLLLLGVFACATSVIWIKLSGLHPVLLASLRCLLAAVVLAPLWRAELRRHGARLDLAELRPALLPGLMLGIHFITWIIGARRTPAANSSLIVNMVPLVMPLFLYAWAREILSRREILGTAIAMLGVLIMTAQDLRLEPAWFAGDAICFISMLFFCVYLVLRRRQGAAAPGLFRYVVPLYAFAGLVALLAWLPTGLRVAAGPGALGDSGRELLWLVGLALVPTVIGHTILNHALTVFRGQVVALANLSQIAFAGLLAWAFLGEVPAGGFAVAVALVLMGAFLALR